MSSVSIEVRGAGYRTTALFTECQRVIMIKQGQHRACPRNTPQGNVWPNCLIADRSD